MFSGRLAAKALLMLMCGAAAACADAGAADGAADNTVDETPDALAAVSDPVNSCLDRTVNYGGTGPFSVEQSTSGRVKFWAPRNIPSGCKVPVVHLANGTGATCSNYSSSLQRLASHGFIAACYENTNTGAGEFGIQAFQAATQRFPFADSTKFGSTGHSQGGQAAIVTTQLAEARFPGITVTGLAMQPASGFGTQPSRRWQSVYGDIKSPIFMFSGNSSTGFANSTLLGIGVGDGLVAISWVNQGYDALSRSI